MSTHNIFTYFVLEKLEKYLPDTHSYLDLYVCILSMLQLSNSCVSYSLIRKNRSLSLELPQHMYFMEKYQLCFIENNILSLDVLCYSTAQLICIVRIFFSQRDNFLNPSGCEIHFPAYPAKYPHVTFRECPLKPGQDLSGVEDPRTLTCDTYTVSEMHWMKITTMSFYRTCL